jgi:hypothetical protein
MKKFLLLALLLAGCSSGGGSSGYNIPTPSVGQWVDFGGNEPTITGNSFNFGVGGSIIAGYFYTKFAKTPQVGQTLTLNYTLTANPANPAWVQAPNGGDINPPTIHLFLWRAGDNLSCSGNGPTGIPYAQYRLFAGRTPLVVGANQTISVKLDPSLWPGCFAADSTAAQFTDLLNNLAGVGFTVGGQYFAGHGVYLSSGSATFTINSFTVQ